MITLLVSLLLMTGIYTTTVDNDDWEVTWYCTDYGCRYELTHTPPPPPPEPEPTNSVIATLTWYYCEYDGGYYGDGGGFCGVMRSGNTVYAGAAACGEYWPRFTVLHIEGWGPVVCEDTGSAVRGTHIDVFFYYSSEGTASGLMWERRRVTW